MTKVNVRAAILYVRERTHEYQIIRHCTLSSAVQLRYGTVRYGTAQYGTVGYNTHNSSAVQRCTVQYTTVHLFGLINRRPMQPDSIIMSHQMLIFGESNRNVRGGGERFLVKALWQISPRLRLLKEIALRLSSNR